MSPVFRSETKATQKPSGPVGAGSNVPASAYNPLSGTFHTVEFSPISAASPHYSNGRFLNMDERDDHSGTSYNNVAECDSVSNNSGWSGESEDHKDKTFNSSSRIETIPGAENYKREKIRQKNEKKHQRQKERRVQELQERCNGYLMSRKLEALAQQLVAMGFSQERATMSLILNEGRVEESVAWLFEGCADSRDQKLGMVNLKIDISDELAHVTEMESKYICSRQEVERAIISCEGDLEKAGETLRALKLDTPPSPPKQEETGEPPVGNGKIIGSSSSNPIKVKPNSPKILQRNAEKDFLCLKAAVIEGSSESTRGIVQSAQRSLPKLEWEKPQEVYMPIEKRWLSTGSNTSVSCSLTQSTFRGSSPSTMSETRYVAMGTDSKNLPSGTIKESVSMMQRPQTLSTKYGSASNTSLSHGASSSWYSSANNIETLKCNDILPSIATTGNLNSFDLTPNQMYYQLQHQQQQHFASDVSQRDSPGISWGNSSRGRSSPTPALTAATSLGLFSVSGSAGSSGPSSPVDWKSGGRIHHLDYNNVDWSLNKELSSPSPSKFCLSKSSVMKNNGQVYDFNASYRDSQLMQRPLISNLIRDSITGLKDGAVAFEALTASSREWSSPFEGKDLFRLSRQFVSSATL